MVDIINKDITTAEIKQSIISLRNAKLVINISNQLQQLPITFFIILLILIPIGESSKLLIDGENTLDLSGTQRDFDRPSNTQVIYQFDPSKIWNGNSSVTYNFDADFNINHDELLGSDYQLADKYNFSYVRWLQGDLYFKFGASYEVADAYGPPFTEFRTSDGLNILRSLTSFYPPTIFYDMNGIEVGDELTDFYYINGSRDSMMQSFNVTGEKSYQVSGLPAFDVFIVNSTVSYYQEYNWGTPLHEISHTFYLEKHTGITVYHNLFMNLTRPHPLHGPRIWMGSESHEHWISGYNSIDFSVQFNITIEQATSQETASSNTVSLGVEDSVNTSNKTSDANNLNFPSFMIVVNFLLVL
ncbi:MAG: hypothetical protein HeimC2_38260 [Candidatus Heimdallarchaeota archaeon LC_2]|nr:MAG: hypothetical protein HeimC2_38260 [Candidatus Heimdallarchaeota archaeon LC_2]